ncbi:MAG: hypothetical protein HY683_04740 [Chloroflexi bacterium]|nr:hypothetical protein [Chloroflexota bacterium]
MTRASKPPSDASAARIARLTIVNALVYQEDLADYEPQVLHLRQTLEAPDAVSAFGDHWQYVLEQINYYPIFHVARELLLALPSNPDVEKAVRSLAQTALEIVSKRAALRHDLMGRVYHRLLADAKYLGTYYTSVPAATLLLKLVLQPGRWPINWGDVGELSSFRIGDLACGTGTLLMAGAEALTDNYLRACGEAQTRPKLDILSRLLMEEIIYGYDVLPSALHLTASTLALRAPEVTFRAMHLYNLPLGSRHRRLGSIEFLREFTVPMTADLFGASTTPGQVTAKGRRREEYARLPDLDICVMNPPFTRSVGGNLLFGSLPDSERHQMQQELAKLLRIPRVHASATAGLGSVFAATGDLHLKDGGRMALVLPKALLSGVAWQETRNLFRLKYQLEYLIVSHDPARWNFSENTDLSEVLLVARKLRSFEASPPLVTESVVCLNLWKNPTTPVEALAVAHIVAREAPPDLEKGQGALSVDLGEVKFGEAVAMPWAELREQPWMLPCAFAQSDLLRAAMHLARGNLWMPGRDIAGTIPLCPLGSLGTLGPDRRDIHDGFRLAKGQTAYPAFWSHDAATMTTLAQAPNRHLSPLPRAKTGRPLRRATDLWPKAGRLLLAERLWNYTQHVAAIRLDKPVLSNVWWPFSPHTSDDADEKTLTLWLNSTLGLLLLWSRRLETRGAWVDFKKPMLEQMLVLDTGALTEAQRAALVAAYDRLCQAPLLPFPQMAGDPTRQAIDEAIAGALGLPDLAPLRHMLAREPVVCLRPLA